MDNHLKFCENSIFIEMRENIYIFSRAFVKFLYYVIHSLFFRFIFSTAFSFCFSSVSSLLLFYFSFRDESS